MSTAKIFALIDCNNFFVSCERIFRPDLENRPVVVLSSNDGCVVSRSNEAKRLEIPVGAPAFKYRQIFEQQNVVRFSANFELYGDISKRITSLLTTITPRIEIYSVDESFLDISALPITNHQAWGREVHARILKYIGVPVAIGIAPTKTLAKLAAALAKKDGQSQSVVSLVDTPKAEREELLSQVPVEDIWGVGRKFAPKLRAEGIGTALSLSQLRPQRAKQLLGIRGRQMTAELSGTSCYDLEPMHEPAKSILRSRTFGEDTNQVHVLEAAVATLGTQAAFSLRREGLLTRRISIFASTNYHKPGYRQWTKELRLATPTNDSGHIISLLVNELAAFYSSAQHYHRLGVFLHDFVPENALQTDLLGNVNTAAHQRSVARMQALDDINTKWGRGKIYYAAEKLSDAWRPKHHLRSPRYVSNWDELPVARIAAKRD